MDFREQVRKQVSNISSFGDRKSVSTCLNSCFSIKTDKDKLTKALVILDELLHCSVSGFVYDNKLSLEDATSLVSEILYGFYDGAIDPKLGGEFFLIQLLAVHNIDAATKIIQKLSDEKTKELIHFLFKHPKEGTYFLQNVFHERYQSLIQGFRTYYYDVHAESLDNLEQRAQNEAKELYEAFTTLISTMQSTLIELLGNDEETAVQRKQFLASFAPYVDGNYTEKDFVEFARIFGLGAYPPIHPEGYTENDRLLEKVKAMQKIVSQPRWPLFLQRQDTQSILSFVYAIIDHLEATQRMPIKYKKGLEMVTCTIATSGKELEKLLTLGSILEGYKALQTFLETKGGIKIALKDYPIVVFDQSDKALFLKNHVYIESLNLRYQAKIVHVSREEATELAKKWGILDLVVTKEDGTFGFGGARNCQFMLTAKACGKNESKAVYGDMESKELGQALFLVDDDVLVPEANIFSSALFAYSTQNQPESAVGYQYGRASKFHIHFWGLQEVLDGPGERNMFPTWLDYPTLAGLSEHILRPKFCLNLPHGNEESHSFSIAKGHFFLQPSQHLGGSRYPTEVIPTKFFVGLPETLQKMNAYSLLIYLADYFVNAKGAHGQETLPWNEFSKSAFFRCLDESLAYVSQEEIKKELQTRFWLRVEGFFHLQLVGYRYLLRIVEDLMNRDIRATCEAYAQQNPLTLHEKEALEKLAKVYLYYQQDAKLFWKLGTLLAQSPNPAQELDKIKEQVEAEGKVRIADYPLTEGFYLMAKALGGGTFCNACAKALAKERA